VSREDEINGLDLSEMSLEGYPEYATLSFVTKISQDSNGQPVPQSTKANMVME
jgi:ammonium transporter, Amt family